MAAEVNRRTVIQAMVYGSGSLALAACGAAPPPSAGVSTSAGGSGPITVTDQRGKALTLDAPATRIVTIPMPAASLLVAIDQSSLHLAAMHNASWTAMKDGIMGTMFPDALKVPHDIAANDFTPNVESVRALNPDVVVQWSNAELVAPLENAGLKVLGLNNSGTQDDVVVWMGLFAAILGKTQRAQVLKARSDDEFQRIQTAAAGRTAGPRILYFNRFVGGLKVAAANSYNDFYIRLIGGHNAATGAQGAKGSGMVGTEVEQVLAWDPEVILLGNFDAAMPKDVYGSPVWQGVSAVRNRRVYKVPLGGYRWDPPGQESLLMWNWLSDVSFPQERSSLRGKISDYYPVLYGYSPTPQQIDTMLWMDANGGSANYAQFSSA